MAEQKNPPSTGYITTPHCVVCGVSGTTVQLYQCRSCRRRFCDDCAYHSRMGLFCTTECARRFMVGDSEEEDEEDYEAEE